MKIKMIEDARDTRTGAIVDYAKDNVYDVDPGLGRDLVEHMGAAVPVEPETIESAAGGSTGEPPRKTNKERKRMI